MLQQLGSALAQSLFAACPAVSPAESILLVPGCWVSPLYQLVLAAEGGSAFPGAQVVLCGSALAALAPLHPPSAAGARGCCSSVLGNLKALKPCPWEQACCLDPKLERR